MRIEGLRAEPVPQSTQDLHHKHFDTERSISDKLSIIFRLFSTFIDGMETMEMMQG